MKIWHYCQGTPLDTKTFFVLEQMRGTKTKRLSATHSRDLWSQVAVRGDTSHEDLEWWCGSSDPCHHIIRTVHSSNNSYTVTRQLCRSLSSTCKTRPVWKPSSHPLFEPMGCISYKQYLVIIDVLIESSDVIILPHGYSWAWIKTEPHWMCIFFLKTHCRNEQIHDPSNARGQKR